MFHRAGPILFCMLLTQGCASNGTPQPDAGLQTAEAGSPPARPAEARSGESPQRARAASRVYRDPVTGEFTSPPAVAEQPSAQPPTRETSRTAPVPDPQELAVEGGGTKVQLHDGFRTYTRASKDAAGNMTIECEVASPVR